MVAAREGASSVIWTSSFVGLFFSSSASASASLSLSWICSTQHRRCGADFARAGFCYPTGWSGQPRVGSLFAIFTTLRSRFPFPSQSTSIDRMDTHLLPQTKTSEWVDSSTATCVVGAAMAGCDGGFLLCLDWSRLGRGRGPMGLNWYRFHRHSRRDQYCQHHRHRQHSHLRCVGSRLE